MRCRLLCMIAVGSALLAGPARAGQSMNGAVEASGSAVRSGGWSGGSGTTASHFSHRGEAALDAPTGGDPVASAGAGAGEVRSRHPEEYAVSRSLSGVGGRVCVTSRSVLCLSDGGVVAGWGTVGSE